MRRSYALEQALYVSLDPTGTKDQYDADKELCAITEYLRSTVLRNAYDSAKYFCESILTEFPLTTDV